MNRKIHDIYNEQITPNFVYNLLAILVWSIIMFVLAGTLISPNISTQTKPGFSDYLGIVFFSLAFFGIIYLVAHHIIYYSSKSWAWFRDSFSKYKLYYALALAVLAVSALVLLGWHTLEHKVFWETIFNVGLTAFIGLLGWILIKIYSHWRKRK